jgi:hypothetical protein
MEFRILAQITIINGFGQYLQTKKIARGLYRGLFPVKILLPHGDLIIDRFRIVDILNIQKNKYRLAGS